MMMKNSFFRQPTKVLSCPTKKNISLASIAKQLQSTNLDDSPAIYQPMIDQDNQPELLESVRRPVSPKPKVRAEWCDDTTVGDLFNSYVPSPKSLLVHSESGIAQVLVVKPEVSNLQSANCDGESLALAKDFTNKHLTQKSVPSNCTFDSLQLDIAAFGEYQAQPSMFGKALCLNKNRQKTVRLPISDQRKRVVCSRFQYSHQIAASKSFCYHSRPVLKPPQIIQEFDFSTPSPDDIVKEKQKKAY
jgi:hypothetical protein